MNKKQEFYFVFLLVLIIFIFNSEKTLSQNYFTEIYIGIGNTLGYSSPDDFIYDYTYFNIDFGNIFNIYEEEIKTYYFPFVYYIGIMLNKKFIYYMFEVEIATFFSRWNYPFTIPYIGLINYYKIGTGLYYKFGNIILKVGINTGVGFYLMKVFDVSHIENQEYIGQILYDGFVFLEPQLSIGFRLTSNFIIYFGEKIQWGLFFTKQLKVFNPTNIFIMLSIII